MTSSGDACPRLIRDSAVFLAVQHLAGQESLRGVGDESIPQGQNLTDARIGDRVIDVAAATLGFHEATPSEARQVARHSALRRSKQRNQLRNAPLTLQEDVEDTDAGGIAQTSEEPRRSLRARGRQGERA